MICFVSFFCSLLIHQPCLFSFDHHLVGIEAEWISRDQEALVISTSFYMILVISTWSRYQFCCKLRRRCVMTCQLVVTDEWWPTQWRIDGMQQHKKLPSWVKYLAWFPPTFASVTCMRSAEVFPLLFWSSDVVVQPYNSVPWRVEGEVGWLDIVKSIFSKCIAGWRHGATYCFNLIWCMVVMLACFVVHLCIAIVDLASANGCTCLNGRKSLKENRCFTTCQSLLN